MNPAQRRILPTCLALLALLALAACGREPATPPTAPDLSFAKPPLTGTDLAESEWLVRLHPGAEASAVAGRLGMVLEAVDVKRNLCRMQGAATQVLLEADPDVLKAEIEQIAVLSDPLDMLMGFHEGDWTDGAYPRQDALAPLRLAAAQARAQGRDVRVAVLDTGADLTHPWLRPALEIDPYPGLGDGMEVASHIDEDGDGIEDEAFGHGTHVAGLIRAVAPSARILPFRIMDSEGRGKLFKILLGMEAALERDVDVVNLSFRLSQPSALMDEVLDRMLARGIRVVAAAGNRPGDPVYPASHPGVLAVAASDGDLLAGFSARGDLAAPGVAVVSSYPGGLRAFATGTSMATALVSGCVALLGPADPSDPGRAARLLESTATDLEGSEVGRVNPWAAVLGLTAAPSGGAGTTHPD